MIHKFKFRKKALLEEKTPKKCQFKMKASPLSEPVTEAAKQFVQIPTKKPENLRTNTPSMIHRSSVTKTSSSSFYRWTIFLIVLFVIVISILSVITLIALFKGDEATEAEATSLLANHDHKY